MGFCDVAPVEERAEGKKGVSSGSVGKGLQGLGTKVRLIIGELSTGGTGKDFAFEKKAFMEAVLVAEKRGWGNLPADVVCACCMPKVGAKSVGNTSVSPVDS